MKKSLKIILVIIILIFLYVVVDLFFIYKNNRPIFYFSENHLIDDNDKKLWQSYNSVFYNVYNCTQYPSPQIKAKWDNYTCPITETKTIKKDVSNDNTLNEIDGVTMSISEGTLTRKSADIVIKDTTAKENIYGEEYRIDKKVNNKWQELDAVKSDYAWNSIGYYVDENNELNMKINWEWLYGTLTDGEYRIVKNTGVALGSRYYFSVEFVIE